ncbi:FG-GAP-like repeat-containing protein, partial [bacterium]|nr:FG-GAP-like repeat-containing protein [bacterium]
YSAELELSSLAAGDGSTGFVLNGLSGAGESGFSVSSAGDINGDGFDDIIIGAPYSNSGDGEAYVVFGKGSGFSAEFELSTLAAGDGSIGFVLNGIDGSDLSGASVSSAGDVNGDGYDDLIIGARNADPNGTSSGETYVVFGKGSGFSAEFELSTLAAGDGSTGFVLNGIDTNDFSGVSVSSAGDVNGDGFEDLLVGANGADPHSTNTAGETYVVFGKSGGYSAQFELSTLASGDGSTGFVLNGSGLNDRSGSSVSTAGDVNGDGFDDLLVGAYFAAPNGGFSGETYVVLGKSSGFDAEIELSDLNGLDGFALNGIDSVDHSGWSVSSAGDVNGDGFDDILIGAPSADPNGMSSGETYLVYGGNGFGFSVNLTGNDTAEKISGSSFNDKLDGAGGNDRIDGGQGRDDMVGGTGDDTFIIDNVGDTVTENVDEGTDTVEASIDFTLGDNVENLKLTGTAQTGTGNNLDNIHEGNAADNILCGMGGHDELRGFGGSDILDGGLGADDMSGGTGDDTFIVDNAGDTVTENADEGTDTVEASIDFTLGDNFENLKLTGTAQSGTGNNLDNILEGNAANNVLNGNGGKDSLIGGEGKDSIDGGGGKDFIEGGNGKDTLTGGSGKDTFYFKKNFGVDKIKDFTRKDVIDVSKISSIKNFSDLMNNHVKQSGKHAIIKDGNDKIKILNFDIDDFNANDFII